MGEVYDSGVWRTPLGEVAIDEPLAAAILASGELLRSNPGAHANEHSIEVQVPLLQAVAPQIRIVPIAVPPPDDAVEIGRAVGRTLAKESSAASGVRVIGSSDLTHHGGHFGSPGGSGEASEKFARQNDGRMLELIEAMDAEAIVGESAAHRNACGAGAIAATIAACLEMGAARGIRLEYTNSYVITHEMNGDNPDDTAVGYASVVFA